jgi:hypothetical protein
MQCVTVFTEGVARAVEAVEELLDTHRAGK